MLAPILEKGMHIKEEYDKQKVTWEKYKTLFGNQRGGLYEHDLYTELIEKTLTFIHERDNKFNSTLIIEDMDRIDPAHLFRILNVLGAHLDNGSGNGNKFGFKNIILVLDYKTTAHVFHHFYGEHANYDGYMSKFISHNVFHYDIEKAAQTELLNTMIKRCLIDEAIIKSLPVSGSSYPNAVTLGTIINGLNVRKIASILDNLDDQIIQQPLIANEYRILNIAPITILLSVIVRLDKPIDYDVLYRFIYNKLWGLKLFQQYLLFSKAFSSGQPFLFYSKELIFIKPNVIDDGYHTASIHKLSGGYANRIDLNSNLRKCFDMAMANVKDCL